MAGRDETEFVLIWTSGDISLTRSYWYECGNDECHDEYGEVTWRFTHTECFKMDISFMVGALPDDAEQAANHFLKSINAGNTCHFSEYQQEQGNGHGDYTGVWNANTHTLSQKINSDFGAASNELVLPVEGAVAFATDMITVLREIGLIENVVVLEDGTTAEFARAVTPYEA